MIYNVGVYVRISKEDDRSVSVENQKTMLSKFISIMPGWSEQKTYVDDGWSGGNFNRPAFQEMIADAKLGKINLVLVKDLSRFGRNYLEAGNYLQNVLPDAGCRFVSISDGIDTSKGETDIMYFMNFVNDYYLKNLSSRIKTVLTAKVKNGEYLSGVAPFGYKRDPNDNHKLIVDEYAAGVVKRIFEMRYQKMGYNKIAGVLNCECISAPREYWYQSRNKSIKTERISGWRDSTVRKLLANKVYIGHTVAQMTCTLSHRSKKKIKRPRDEWLNIENTHTPIIEQKLWEAVQVINKKASNQSNAKNPNAALFSGMLICDGCGAKLNSCKEKHKRKKTGKSIYYTYYACAYHIQTGRALCSRHCIYEISLKNIILEQIKLNLENSDINESRLTEILQEQINNNNKDTFRSMNQQIKKLNRRINILETMIVKLYEEKVIGVVSDEFFLNTMPNYETERTALQKQKNTIETELNKIQNRITDKQASALLIKSKLQNLCIDRDFLLRTINRIEIGEKITVDDVKHQHIKIFYKNKQQ